VAQREKAYNFGKRKQDDLITIKKTTTKGGRPEIAKETS